MLILHSNTATAVAVKEPKPNFAPDTVVPPFILSSAPEPPAKLEEVSSTKPSVVDEALTLAVPPPAVGEGK
ncbi:hypothetical protein D3C87_1218670 [compost metagenome]